MFHAFHLILQRDVAKITKQQLQQTKDRFQAFLNGDTQIVADEAFINAVQSFHEVFLKSDRVAKMVQSGGFSANDFREVFKRHIEKRVRSLPEIDGLSKETVLSSWMAKFDTIYRGDEDPRKAQQRMTASAASELILSKDQLYEMFQNILGIKKFEHQLLYQACQVPCSSNLVLPAQSLFSTRIHPWSAVMSACYVPASTGESVISWAVNYPPASPLSP
ncbi:unnamed protein product [Pleuronectes platessa]|uniref:Calcium-dependent secretion activator 1 n=1 Tax=Pleuronectes platessa TaxID=8262 RepID=A0A9N7YUN7_PLEPL|nr:unnamed protein product [Pleuronectes platessa]